MKPLTSYILYPFIIDTFETLSYCRTSLMIIVQLATKMSARFVPFHQLDREWDARFNVPTDEDLDLILQSVKSEAQQGKFRFALVSGLEIGTRPFQDDYLIRHVHLCLLYNNRVSKSSILKNLSVKQGNGA